ncbi:hypothetical protein [Corallococcus carmarthensis]|uniref:WD40 repeat domain-containing protein n=1 Tax=Corallococcus carmarthensis TaxID=2316728 RepID=A0A3A8JUU9_9BACT|nr:hypothetical protein [Corallococcus carmarthensis]NOK20076.1 hypothetical protein [Corallococcus carmarthensis]RKG98975.1 hypothetical protein D7X32_27850 [Corallococcus carmarthensis]
MSGREVQLAAGRKSARQTRSASARAWTLTLVIAAGLGLLLYVATTSLPYLIASPAGDAHLGALNDCLARQLKGATRLGWAVAPDASRVAVFGPRVVAVCGEDGSHARLEVPGATALTFDGERHLWVATGGHLLRERDGALQPVGDIAPPEWLIGHAGGVLALDATGQLVSVALDGKVLGQAQVPGPGGRLSVGPGGVLAAVEWGGGVIVYDARTLELVRAEAPCAVEFLWWLDTADQVLLACGATGAQDAPAPASLRFDVRTGAREAVPARTRAPARRLSGRALYVQGCDGFPCTASPP